jgi:nitrite reductase/ring-hydroxylating ferredoxin subunit
VAPQPGRGVIAPRPAASLSTWPPGWYVVARSRDVRAGGVVAGEIAGRPLVLVRSESGALAAFDAHCPHMGTHLRHGEIVGERLICPLHRWAIALDGACSGGGGAERVRATTWPVRERFGLVFLHAGAGPPPPLPQPDAPDDYSWTTARPVVLDAAWHAMMVNSFDLLHFRAVHRREFVEEPEFTRAPDGALRLRYVSRVTGRALGDRVMKWLASDRIRVQQTCRGTTMVVETDLGRTRTAAILGLLPSDGRIRAFGAFGVLRSGRMLRLRRAATRWLFTDFLARDFAVVEGMRLSTQNADDRGVAVVADYLSALPDLRDA